VITIVFLCALIISLFGGYFDQPTRERLFDNQSHLERSQKQK